MLGEGVDIYDCEHHTYPLQGICIYIHMQWHVSLWCGNMFMAMESWEGWKLSLLWRILFRSDMKWWCPVTETEVTRILQCF